MKVAETPKRSPMNITHYRPQREGPEAEIQDAVARQLLNVLAFDTNPIWTASSLPIGGGLPDLIAVSYEPDVVALANAKLGSPEILAYLRAVGRARLDTIIDRVARPRSTVVRCLNGLCEMRIVSVGFDTFTLNPRWREILPEIVTVEVKVNKWRDAVAQAARNRIFAHRSFVALPLRVATRVRAEPIFGQTGIGILAVADDGAVQVVKRARKSRPRVWAYYYRVAAFAAAAQAESKSNALLSLN